MQTYKPDLGTLISLIEGPNTSYTWQLTNNVCEWIGQGEIFDEKS